MDYTPSAEDTQIDALEDNRPIPPIPTPTPVPESTTNLTSPQSCDLLAGQRPIEVEVEVDLSLPLSLRIVAKRVNRDGAESFKMASTGSWVTEYELERLKQMEKNRQLLVETMPVSASQILPVKPRKSTATTRQRRDRVKVTVQEKRTLPRRQARWVIFRSVDRSRLTSNDACLPDQKEVPTRNPETPRLPALPQAQRRLLVLVVTALPWRLRLPALPRRLKLPVRTSRRLGVHVIRYLRQTLLIPSINSSPRPRNAWAR